MFPRPISVKSSILPSHTQKPKPNLATIDALAIFFNSLGGAISVSVAQNIFSNTLIQQIPRMTHGVDPAAIIAAGATHVHEVALPGQLQGVLEAYDMAIVRAFIVPIAVGGIAMICSFFVSLHPFRIGCRIVW